MGIHVTVFNSSDELYNNPAIYGSDFYFDDLNKETLDFINIVIKQNKYVVINKTEEK